MTISPTTGLPIPVASPSHTRWEGKPTSGRYVYQGRESGRWWWQCDLCEEPNYGEGALGWEDQRGAWDEAMRHTLLCPGYPPEDAPRDAHGLLLPRWQWPANLS